MASRVPRQCLSGPCWWGVGALLLPGQILSPLSFRPTRLTRGGEAGTAWVPRSGRRPGDAARACVPTCVRADVRADVRASLGRGHSRTAVRRAARPSEHVQVSGAGSGDGGGSAA